MFLRRGDHVPLVGFVVEVSGLEALSLKFHSRESIIFSVEGPSCFLRNGRFVGEIYLEPRAPPSVFSVDLVKIPALRHGKRRFALVGCVNQKLGIQT